MSLRLPITSSREGKVHVLARDVQESLLPIEVRNSFKGILSLAEYQFHLANYPVRQFNEPQ